MGDAVTKKSQQVSKRIIRSSSAKQNSTVQWRRAGAFDGNIALPSCTMAYSNLQPRQPNYHDDVDDIGVDV